jgi:hypothetical protein
MDELIEAAAEALDDVFGEPVSYDMTKRILAVLAPALLEKGVRLGLEAAAKASDALRKPDDLGEYYRAGDVSEAIRAIDAAAIARSEP